MGRGGVLLCGALLAGCRFFLPGADDDVVPDAGKDAPPPTPAVLAVSPASIAFSPTPVGAKRSAMLDVANTGEANCGTISATSPNADLEIQSTCTTLIGQGTCTILATFAPTATETLDDDITVSASPGGTVVVHVTGSASATPNVLSLSSLDLGGASFDMSSAPFAVTVTNDGSVATGPLTVDLPANSLFAIASDGCTNASVPPLASCAISIAYTPATMLGDRATLDVTGIPGGAVSGTLFGYGYHLDVTPHPAAGFAFPLTPVGSTTSQTFTVTNGTTGTLGPLMTAFIPAAVPFAISQDLCVGQSLAPGATCTLSVGFAPTVSGTVTAKLDARAITSSMSTIGQAPLSGTAP